jgi:hypothetical protein
MVTIRDKLENWYKKVIDKKVMDNGGHTVCFELDYSVNRQIIPDQVWFSRGMFRLFRDGKNMKVNGDGETVVDRKVKEDEKFIWYDYTPFKD